MKEIDEKDVMSRLKQEREDMQKQMGNLSIQAKSIDEQMSRLQFELAKKQGAIDEFEKLFSVKPEQPKTEKPLGTNDKVQ